MSESDELINVGDLADAVDAVRETLRAIVAGIVSEGFTEEQARIVAVEIMRQHSGQGGGDLDE